MRQNRGHRSAIAQIARRTVALCGALVLALLPAAAAAQSLEGTGMVSTGLLLRQLDGVKRVLVIGAHPDDEDTSLITALARGWGAETAYLSLTRGDGGQNVIGPELWEGLGVVRTGELEAARRLDGGLQYFTRAFDYGFSKSADEALSFWPREEVLADVVWVIRRFRPHVIISIWSGTPRDGHGQHQASGILAQEAYEAAGDPTRFPEQIALGLEAWAPLKLYESARGDFAGRGGAPTAAAAGRLAIDTGGYDPLLGRSLFQLSMESRSQHRSQDQGSPETPGPRETGVRLLRSRVQDDGSLFSGIDTTLVGLVAPSADSRSTARGVVEVRRVAQQLDAYHGSIARARGAFGLDLTVTARHLAEALGQLDFVRRDADTWGSTELLQALAAKRDVATRAFAAAAGVSVDVRAADDLVVPGQTVRVQTLLWNGGGLAIEAPEVALRAPDGWRATVVSSDGIPPDGVVPPGTLVTWTHDVQVPADADPSRLYFLGEARDGAMYRWPEATARWALPRDPAPVTATVAFRPQVASNPAVPRLALTRAWRHVSVDPTRGEVAKAVLVVPAVSARVTPSALVWPEGRSEARTVSVVVRNESAEGSRGQLFMHPPAGWIASPPFHPFDLAEAGAERTFTFEVTPSAPPEPGQHVFGVIATTLDGRTFVEGYTLVDYEHIERAALFAQAEATVSVLPVAVAEGLRVGYVMGSGDDGPEALRQIGVDVTLLDEARVRAGAFADFDAVVLGVRAQEVRADLRASAAQLHDYVRRGGVVVAQYNRGPLEGMAPGQLDVGRSAPRVADETRPVRLLDADAPVLTTPNRIGDADFVGWVQERGLYFASTWGDEYVPLLELNDVGEDPQRGALLVAADGEGVFVYAALSFFRQWSAGVPGAYRLFANLISLDPAAWRAYAAGR